MATYGINGIHHRYNVWRIAKLQASVQNLEKRMDKFKDFIDENADFDLYKYWPLQ